jgi:oxygen-independent coproporphyrinogen-3 oxidase
MEQRLLRLAERTAPRYTSYPTAPHFTAKVDAATYAGWLAGFGPKQSLSLYLHIPFCRSICSYCGCHTVATKREEPVHDYAKALQSEIDLVAAVTPARRVISIHWGGGTPNMLGAEWFIALVSRLAARFDFSRLQEHSVEIDPRLLTPDHVAAFAEMGVTRASLGVQDLNLHVQEAIGRVQPLSMVVDAVGRLREAGVRGINFDLMYGLPEQSVEDAARTARDAAALKPDRLAVFGYAHVPWFKTRQRLIDADKLPDTGLRLAQAEAMREELVALGYIAIGFDHFAKWDDPLAQAAASGDLTRSFQGYAQADADALIGLGASSISTLPQGYAQNTTEIAAWARSVSAGQFATARGVEITEEDRRRRAIIDRLLCDFAVDLKPFGGAARFGDAVEELRLLAADGVVRLKGDRVEITSDGRPFARLAAQAFDAYREVGAARHSKAV